MRRQDSVLLRRACLAAVAVAGVLLCGACASSKPLGVAEDAAESKQILALSEGEGALALEKKFAVDRNDVTYGENGTVTGGKRSQFEGKRQVAFGGDWGGKNYEKPEYEKTWWGGQKKKKPMKQYAGNQDGSRFKVESLMMGKSAPQSGKRSVYDGNGVAVTSYDTGKAREAGVKDLPHPTDARTDWRRAVQVQPRITGYKQQQQLEVEETRRLLGRD